MEERRLQTISLLTIAAIMFGVMLKAMSVVLIPLVLAVMFSYLLAPIVDWSVNRFSIPKTLGIGFSLLVSLVLIVIIGLMISSSISVLSEHSDEYEKHIQSLISDGTNRLNDGPIQWLEQYGIELNTAEFKNVLSQVPISKFLGGLTNTLLSFLSNTFLILIFVIYLLEGRNPKQASNPLIAKIEAKIEKYLLIKMVLSLITGVSVGLILWMLDIELAMVFGLLAFILNFIPNVGSIIATLLPLPIILVQPEISLLTIILAVVLPGTIQMVVGNVVEPKLLGDSLELHPITVLMSLIFWGIIWGIAGMLLAAPITAVCKILLESSDITRPIAKLLEGKIVFGEDTSADQQMSKAEIIPEIEPIESEASVEAKS